MFATDVSALDTAATLAAVAAAHEQQRQSELDLILLAQHYTHLHPSTARIRNNDQPGGEQTKIYGGEGCPEITEFAAAEFGVVTATSTTTATKFIGQANALPYRFPHTWQQVLSGDATAWKARQIVQECVTLTADAAAIVDRRVAPIIDTVTYSQLTKIIKAAKWEADPDTAKADAQTALNERGVWIGRTDEHGTTRLCIKTATGDIIQLKATIDQLANALQALGDTTPINQRRARAAGLLSDPTLAADLLTTAHHLATQPTATEPEPGAGPSPTAQPTADTEPTPNPAPTPDPAPAPGADPTPGPQPLSAAKPTRDAEPPSNAEPASGAEAAPGATGGPTADTESCIPSASEPATEPDPPWASSTRNDASGTAHTEQNSAYRATSSELRGSAEARTSAELPGSAEQHGPSESGMPPGQLRSARSPWQIEPLESGGPPGDERTTAPRRTVGGGESNAPSASGAGCAGRGVDGPAGSSAVAGMDVDDRLELRRRIEAIRLSHPEGRGRRVYQTVVNVHITDETLFAGAGTARVEGYGPVFTHQLAELLGHHRIVVRPVIDLNEAISVHAYEIPGRIREHLYQRFPVEQFPYGAGETTHSTDLDHIEPYRIDGPAGQTSTGNLSPLRRLSHRIKTHGGWSVSRIDDYTLEWTTLHGYVVHVDHNGTHPVRRIRDKKAKGS